MITATVLQGQEQNTHSCITQKYILRAHHARTPSLISKVMFYQIMSCLLSTALKYSAMSSVKIVTMICPQFASTSRNTVF